MTDPESLPETIGAILAQRQLPETTLNRVVEQVGRALDADRCFLYLRQPTLQRGRVAVCWRRNETVPDAFQPDWREDTGDLPDKDPLFRAAITLKPSVYVDDVETAGPDVLNRAFEAENFGHRALIHAHVTGEGQLWGVLQPCLFGRPRYWTAGEKRQIEAILPLLQPVIAAFVNES
ncbi:MAG: GAF domain-containing protein [Bacteroidetes bacterium]|nr:GAF domain-containing protein [Fibrella sp.]